MSLPQNKETVDESQIVAEAAKQFLSFTVKNETYGVDIMSVREIKGWTDTTRIPESPECMRGVMNLRGIIVPIFDMRVRFFNEHTAASASNVVIILAVGERHIGLLADAVSDILSVFSHEIKPAPQFDYQNQSHFITGIISANERMVVLLDIGHLFDEESLNTTEPKAA